MAAPSASTNVGAPPSAFVEPQQPVYVAPSVLSKLPDQPGSNAPEPMIVSTSTAEVIDEPPPPHTLAKGRYEVKQATIWLVLAGAAIVTLLYVLWRVRGHERAKKRARERLVALKPLGKIRA